MSGHNHRCGQGCPHFDGQPPAHLRVRPGFGICRHEPPRARYGRADEAVFPSWPWVDGAADWCGRHPGIVRARAGDES